MEERERVKERERGSHFKFSSTGEDVTFPSNYPSGCLLGCVEVADCLNKDEYIEKVLVLVHNEAVCITGINPFPYIHFSPLSLYLSSFSLSLSLSLSLSSLYKFN